MHVYNWYVPEMSQQHLVSRVLSGTSGRVNDGLETARSNDHFEQVSASLIGLPALVRYVT